MYQIVYPTLGAIYLKRHIGHHKTILTLLRCFKTIFKYQFTLK